MFRLSANTRILILAFVYMFPASAMSDTLARAASTDSPTSRMSVPLADEAHGVARKHSGSAFLLSYRGKTFVVSNAHVVLNAGVTNQFFIQVEEQWVPLPARWKFTNTADIAAIDISTLVRSERAGVLRTETADLVAGQTALAALCNPLLFKDPIIGIFNQDEGVDLEVRFLGKNLAPFCSGAPLVDNAGRVRGIVFGRIEGYGYALPARTIVRFLDEKFF